MEKEEGSEKGFGMPRGSGDVTCACRMDVLDPAGVPTPTPPAHAREEKCVSPYPGRTEELCPSPGDPAERSPRIFSCGCTQDIDVHPSREG